MTKLSNLPFDPSIVSQHQNPYVLFKQYGDMASIQKGTSAVPGYSHTWYFFGYEEAKKMLHADFTEPNLRTNFEATDNQSTHFLPERLAIWQHVGNWAVFQNAPLHMARRTLLAQSFKQSAINGLVEFVQYEADRLITSAAKKEAIDVQREFIIPLSVAVISKLVGIPVESPNWLKATGIKVSLALDFGSSSQHYIEGWHALNEIIAFVKEKIAWKQTHLADDIASHLMSNHKNAPLLDTETVINMLTELLILGQETTSDTFGNAIYSFTQQPSQLALLQANPELVNSAVSEILRFNASLMFTSARVLKKDFSNGDTHIKAGETTIAVIGGCNRDARQFENPNVFDVQRKLPVPEFTFGYGVHYCIGSHLARLVIKTALQTLVKKLPAPWVVQGTTAWRPNNNMQGPTSLTLKINH